MLIPVEQVNNETWQATDTAEMQKIIDRLAQICSSTIKVGSPMNVDCCAQQTCQLMTALTKDFSRFYGRVRVLNFNAERHFEKLSARIHVLTSLKAVYEKLFTWLGVDPVQVM